MVEYSIKKIVLRNGKEKCIPVISDERYAILEDLISVEVRMFKKSIINVLTGISENNYFTGNCCYLEVNDEKATVEGLIDGADMGDPVTLPVDELIDLINRWCEDIKDLPKRAEE